MRVRAATRADVPAIVDIYNHAVRHTTATADYEPQSPGARTEWFEAHERDGLPVIVAEAEDGTLAGWASLNRYHGRPGYRFTVENSIYVAEPMRGRGVGRLLLARLVEEARARPVRLIVASIAGGNEASVRLHAAAGFTDAGRLRDAVYKFDRWIDVVYMELLLPLTVPG